MTELDAIRAADFDWAVRLNDVWRPSSSDVPGLHARLRDAFARKLDAMERNGDGGCPLGWVVVGDGGSGKTHLLGAFRREATRRGCPFVMVDLTDVRNFWECVLQGYMGSLEQELDGEVPQHKWVLENIIARYGSGKSFTAKLSALLGRKSADLRGDVNDMLGALSKPFPKETMRYQDVVRALICLNSDDFTVASLGHAWLRGLRIEDEDRKRLGVTVDRELPKQIVEALSWFTSLAGPTVIAFDQMDPIVAQLHYRSQGENHSEAEQATAKSIIAEIGGGLGALRDVARNTLTLASCIELTWENLRASVLKPFLDRFEEPRRLNNVGADLARAIVAERLAPAFKAAGVTHPHPTYPFAPSAFEELAVDSPREILMKCNAHLANCLDRQRVEELQTFVGGGGGNEDEPEPLGDNILKSLDHEFQSLRAAANPSWILEEKHDDDRLAPLLQNAMACLVHENDLGPGVLASVDVRFTGGKKTVPLHARLRLIFPNENEREEHYGVRALQQTSPRAFQSRLKDALTLSGIDRPLSFRHLAVVRTTELPGGAVTKKLIEEFLDAGGLFLHPTEDELRTLHALHELKARNAPGFEAWLKARRPASNLAIVKAIAPSDQINGGGSKPQPEPPQVDPPPEVSDFVPKPEPAGRLPLGRRLQGGKAGESVGMPVRLLEKHAVVLAGSGSGKTVFLKRLIEESALLGVPSIVIDVANDMAALGERWAEPPSEWTDADRDKAERYHREAEVVVWTPGKESGKPLFFEPMPDLAPLADDEEELDTAILSVVETLTPIVAAGKNHAAKQKQALLTSSLRHFARSGGGLDALIELLKDLPPEASLDVANESTLTTQMADALKAEIVTNPMLRSSGAPFDPGALFGSDRASGSTRVSVVSLVGLPGLEAQRYFLNQLAMTLFSWIKKNPDPGDRPMRGLLVIDEAKDFVPSMQATVCRESLRRLVAQARKYRLGLVFATQNPKDLDNKIIGNCATHVYGKMNAPVAIETVRDLIRLKGGSGDDVAKLPRGRFYVHNADSDFSLPTRIEAPLCLSRHPVSPLDESTVLASAAASRSRLRARPRDARIHAVGAV